jgi:hypothetical protein
MFAVGTIRNAGGIGRRASSWRAFSNTVVAMADQYDVVVVGMYSKYFYITLDRFGWDFDVYLETLKDCS